MGRQIAFDMFSKPLVTLGVEWKFRHTEQQQQ